MTDSFPKDTSFPDMRKSLWYQQAVANQGMIIEMICWFGQIEYCIHTGNRAQARALLEVLPESLDKENPVYELLQDNRDLRKLYSMLNDKIFTFMYR